MKKVTEIYYLSEEERLKISIYSDGFLYILEDGTKIYSMTTDVIANYKYEKPSS